uniref:Ribosomal protein S11 n=1 Tax=Globodera rostochiensis TaxID=31243 RepID=A0A914HHL5_GLORO
MIRSFTLLHRSLLNLRQNAPLTRELSVGLQKKAVMARHLHVTAFRFNPTADDEGKPVENAANFGEVEKSVGTKKASGSMMFGPQTLRLRPGKKENLIRNAVKISQIDGEDAGMAGSKSLLSMNTADIDRQLPTAMTLVQQFDGVPFRELPVVHIKASPNNTIIHVFNIQTKRALLYTSARKEGFKHTKKKSSLAGQTTGTATGQKLLRRGISTVRVVVKGIGPGRISSVKGLAAAGVEVVSISDTTRLPELGPRPKKIRRV